MCRPDPAAPSLTQTPRPAAGRSRPAAGPPPRVTFLNPPVHRPAAAAACRYRHRPGTPRQRAARERESHARRDVRAAPRLARSAGPRVLPRGRGRLNCARCGLGAHRPPQRSAARHPSQATPSFPPLRPPASRLSRPWRTLLFDLLARPSARSLRLASPSRQRATPGLRSSRARGVPCSSVCAPYLPLEAASRHPSHPNHRRRRRCRRQRLGASPPLHPSYPRVRARPALSANE